MYNRRRFLQSTLGAGALASASGLIPAWARPASDGNLGIPSLTGNMFDLNIDKFPIRIDGRATQAIGVNGSVPAPLIRFREGDDIVLNVTNTLEEDTSIHWHGLLVPFEMDGVPGVAFPGIKPGETFQYKFAVPQNGTYWYHSHSGLQEQLGHFGPIIVDPASSDPVVYDREYVLMLSDFTFEDPYRLFSKLKANSGSFNFQKRTAADFMRDAGEKGLSQTIRERAKWGKMRMSPTDWSDITGAQYTYLINGHSTADNWNAVFKEGERIRLRIINAAAMTIFNFRIPGLPMTVVAADGLNVQPVETDEFQIGVAETYDVIVTPEQIKAYALVAEAIDRSGMAVATLGPEPGMKAQAPALREPVPLTMKDMGMGDMGAMGGMQMDNGSKASMGNMAGMDSPAMPGMDHSMMEGMNGKDMAKGPGAIPLIAPDLKTGPSTAKLAMAPTSRLDEPGQGLNDVAHRALTYSQLRSLEPNPDQRTPAREIELHLTSNMERYMWSFDGLTWSEVDGPIIFNEGERLRLTLVNDTMMPHPIHLHGMFFDVVNGGGSHKPRKHTITVKPGEKLSVDISAEHVGDWAFHCHLLYHMEAGMFRVVSVMPNKSKTESNTMPMPMALEHPQMKQQPPMDMNDHGTMKMQEQE
ncbi:copper resistance system multicopper oxidase [Hyphomonas pacifica]|jgi:CopA family copper-resistance protein|uniref:copper resistance system multicopper oxidase n=1 Tax=Hyphomonas pacifica TaxID=1280941 RepID=UPI000DD33B67|nr:copper resistance system multicopper oxidase [Hyphomonas pacifica]